MIELSELHLQLAYAAAGALREDVEDQRRAVEDPAIERLLEIALLGGRERRVEDHETGVGGRSQGLDLLDLAAADIAGRIRSVATHTGKAHGFDTGGDHQLLQLLDGIGIVASSQRDADKKRASRMLGALGLDLKDAQVSDSVARLTGRAGTTVEIACL